MQINIQEICQDLRAGNYKSLVLSESNLGDREAIALAKTLPYSGLSTLNLSKNNIGSTGTKALANALKDPRCLLTSLNLESNPITTNYDKNFHQRTYSAIFALQNALKRNLRLIKMLFDEENNFSFNKITEEIQKELAKNQEIQRNFQLFLGKFDQDQQDQQDQERKQKGPQSQEREGHIMHALSENSFLNQQGQKEKIYSKKFLDFLHQFKVGEDLQEKVKKCIRDRILINKDKFQSQSQVVKNKIGEFTQQNTQYMQMILTNLQRLQNQIQNIAKSERSFSRKQFSIRANQCQILADDNMLKSIHVSSDVEKVKAKQILKEKGYTEVSKSPTKNATKKAYLGLIQDPFLHEPFLP